MAIKHKILLLIASIALISILTNWQELKRGFTDGHAVESSIIE